MPWLIGGGVLLALMLSSKSTALPPALRTSSAAPRPRPVARAVPAWHLSNQNSLYGWVNYFLGTSYGPSNVTPVPANAYATTIATACAHAAPSDVPLLTKLASDLQVVIGIHARDAGQPGGIEGMTPGQATTYRNQVLSTIARLSSGNRQGGVVRQPSSIPIAVTPHAPPAPAGYVYSQGGPSGGGGGGGMPSMPSMPGSGGKGGAEGTSPGTDPSTGLPTNVAPDSGGNPYGDDGSGGSGDSGGDVTDLGEID